MSAATHHPIFRGRSRVYTKRFLESLQQFQQPHGPNRMLTIPALSSDDLNRVFSRFRRSKHSDFTVLFNPMDIGIKGVAVVFLRRVSAFGTELLRECQEGPAGLNNTLARVHDRSLFQCQKSAILSLISIRVPPFPMKKQDKPNVFPPPFSSSF